MSDKVGIQWNDWRGRKQTREINLTINVDSFKGTPGYALLILAANAHLSMTDVARYYSLVGIERSRNWLYKRRWLFQPPGTGNSKGPRRDADGREEEAADIISDYPRWSLRDLSALLKARGITRSREWIRRHRLKQPG